MRNFSCWPALLFVLFVACVSWAASQVIVTTLAAATAVEVSSQDASAERDAAMYILRRRYDKSECKHVFDRYDTCTKCQTTKLEASAILCAKRVCLSHALTIPRPRNYATEHEKCAACGCYRKEHENGKGICFGNLPDGCNCEQFRATR